MAGPQPLTVSVVVPTHMRAHMLERVLAPLLDDPGCDELIVVVDGDGDGTMRLVKEMAEREPRLHGVRTDGAGDMAAREAGARAAGGELLVFVDDDVVAEPGLVSGHARRHERGDADLVLGYMPVAPARGRRPGDFGQRLYAREYEGRCAAYERDRDSVLRELWGGNLSIRRDRCLRAPMASPVFTERYHADREFGIRLLKSGMRGAFERSLRAEHLHERDEAAFVRDARSQGAARVLVAQLHPDVVTAPAPDEFERGLPGPAAALVRAGRRPGAREGASAVLGALVRLAGC
ncbi:MAG: glycosyltransferase family 2 protein, partial [Solirubrobacteraceae bacterium]